MAPIPGVERALVSTLAQKTNAPSIRSLPRALWLHQAGHWRTAVSAPGTTSPPSRGIATWVNRAPPGTRILYGVGEPDAVSTVVRYTGAATRTDTPSLAAEGVLTTMHRGCAEDWSIIRQLPMPLPRHLWPADAPAHVVEFFPPDNARWQREALPPGLLPKDVPAFVAGLHGVHEVDLGGGHAVLMQKAFRESDLVIPYRITVGTTGADLGEALRFETSHLIGERTVIDERIEHIFEIIDTNTPLGAGSKGWEQLSEVFHPDLVYRRPGYAPIESLPKVLHFYRHVRVLGSGGHVIDAKVIDPATQRAAVCGRFVGTLKDGTPVDEPFVDVHRYQDGLLIERTTYFYRAAI